MDLSLVPYAGAKDAAAATADEGEEAENEAEGGGSGGCGRYRECLRNHAAAMGGQAYDGCGEFMPGGEEGSLEALKCAACGCHRNFHRRDGLSSAASPRPLLLYGPAGTWNGHGKQQPPPPPQFPAFLSPALTLPYHPMQPPPLAAAPPPPLPPCPPDLGCRVGSETPPRRDEAPAPDSGAASGGSSSRKRFRTKFTAEQKEKMQAFAEKLGWRVPKQDDVALEEFCLQIGVKRHVLKVWMHNNKSHLSSSSSSSSSATTGAAPAAGADPTAAAPIRV